MTQKDNQLETSRLQYEAQKHKMGMLKVVGRQLNRALRLSAIITTNIRNRN